MSVQVSEQVALFDIPQQPTPVRRAAAESLLTGVATFRHTALRRECDWCQRAQAAAHRGGVSPVAPDFPRKQRATVEMRCGDVREFLCRGHADDAGYKGRA